MIATNKLQTWENGATRAFNAVEAEGAINDADTSAFSTVYVRFEMNRAAGASWAGMSLYDFGNERFLFGAPRRESRRRYREFAIHDLAAGGTLTPGIAPVDGQSYTLVAKLDFIANTATLWLDPVLTNLETANTPIATRPYTGTNWMTALRLASGGTAATTWDNVAVSTSWRGLQSAFGRPRLSRMPSPCVTRRRRWSMCAKTMPESAAWRSSHHRAAAPPVWTVRAASSTRTPPAHRPVTR